MKIHDFNEFEWNFDAAFPNELSKMSLEYNILTMYLNTMILMNFAYIVMNS